MEEKITKTENKNTHQKERYFFYTDQLTVGYDGKPLIKEINIQLKKGEILTLIGPNGAGKSTILKSITRQLATISGTVYLDKQTMSKMSNKEVSQKLAVVLTERMRPELMTCEDIVATGRYPYTGTLGILSAEDKAKVRKAMETVHAWDLKDRDFTAISDGQRQRILLARAICQEPEIIVLDEPTSSLTAPEVAKLFKMMRQLKAQGISLIYISHKMDEIFEICDEISVLRDGSLVMTKESKDTNMNELISAMVGRSLDNRFPPVDNTPGETVLSVQNLSTKYAPKLQNISFDIRKGEIFGLYGLVGAGRTELLETIFGMRTRAAGNVIYNGKTMNFSSPKDAMDHGFALITEERKANGLFLKADITFNTTIANMNHYKSGIALSHDSMVRATAEEIKVMHTKCMGPDDMISSLSGGNQQKAIFGKWLERSPNIFMMDDPTRGIDVGAKYEIYELIINMAKQGKTIIVVSSEMPEILGITNRIGVMSNGHLAGIVNTKETNQEELLRLSAKYL